MPSDTQLQFIVANNLSDISRADWLAASDVYMRAFAEPPYQEGFAPDEATSNIQAAINLGGQVIIGKCDLKVVAVAAGFVSSEVVYTVGELAVDPNMQGHGFGYLVLKKLIEVAKEQPRIKLIGLKTSLDSANKAIGLYRKFGFKEEAISELVPELKSNGKIKLSEHISMHLLMPGVKNDPRQSRLRRVVVATANKVTTAVILDYHLKTGLEPLHQQVVKAWRKFSPRSPQIDQSCIITFADNPNNLAKVEMLPDSNVGAALLAAAYAVTKNAKNYEAKLECSLLKTPAAFIIENGNFTVSWQLPNGHGQTSSSKLKELSRGEFKLI